MATFVETFMKKFAASSFADVFESRTWPKREVDPAVWSWLETYFEKALADAYPYETVQLDRLDPTVVDENTLTIEGRFVGDEQNANTEVPQWLAHRALEAKLAQLGAVKHGTKRKPVEMALSVNWQIRYMDCGYVNSSYYTVYDIRATFRITSARKGSN